MEEGVEGEEPMFGYIVAVPPEMVNAKSLASNAPLPPDVLYAASLNVTAMVVLLSVTVVPVIAAGIYT